MNTNNNNTLSFGVLTKTDSSGVAPTDIIGKILLVTIVSVALFVLRCILIMLAWNMTLPSIWPVQVPRISFKQALGIALLTSLLPRRPWL